MFSLSQSLGIQIRHSSHMVYSFFLFYFLFFSANKNWRKTEMATDSSSFFLFRLLDTLLAIWKSGADGEDDRVAKVENGSSIRQWIFMIDIGLSNVESVNSIRLADWNQAEHRIRLAHFGLPVHENGRRPYTCARLLLGRLTDWLAGQSCQGFRLSSLYNSLGFSFLTLVTRWPADAVTYGRSCRCCCCCCCRLAQHLTLFREEKKRNGSLSVYRLPYPNSLESLPNQLIGKNGEL
jgi:hypothetical protein